MYGALLSSRSIVTPCVRCCLRNILPDAYVGPRAPLVVHRILEYLTLLTSRKCRAWIKTNDFATGNTGVRLFICRVIFESIRLATNASSFATDKFYSIPTRKFHLSRVLFVTNVFLQLGKNSMEKKIFRKKLASTINIRYKLDIWSENVSNERICFVVWNKYPLVRTVSHKRIFLLLSLPSPCQLPYSFIRIIEQRPLLARINLRS